MLSLPLADLINWGWLRIGPPYLYLNIDPIIFQIGPVAVRWYGLMYVIGILMGLFTIRGYVARKGIGEDVLYRTLWWAIVAGIIGGRLYFVVQQHDLVQDYLLQPLNIIATWKGGMAFYGAIFLVIPTIFWRARREDVNPLVLVDAAVLFAAAGQIFGRIGNIINGDVVGYPSTLPWSTVYLNPNSFSSVNIPVQPAAVYELLINLVLLGIMLYLAKRVTRPGILMLFYLFSYSISQFFLFFVRDNTIETPFGLDWGLKQAQWTSLVLFILLFPITYWVLRISKRVPADEVTATDGIAKPSEQDSVIYDTIASEQPKEDLQLPQDKDGEMQDIQLASDSSSITEETIEDTLSADEIQATETQDIQSSPELEEAIENALPADEVQAMEMQDIQSSSKSSPVVEEPTPILLSTSEDAIVLQDSSEHPIVQQDSFDRSTESQDNHLIDLNVDPHAELAILQDFNSDSQEPIVAESDQKETASADDPLEMEKEEIPVPVYAGAIAELEPDNSAIASDLTAAIPVKQLSTSNAGQGRKSSSGKNRKGRK